MRSPRDYARRRWLAASHPAATIPVGRSLRDFPRMAGWRKRRYGKPGFSSLHFTEAVGQAHGLSFLMTTGHGPVLLSLKQRQTGIAARSVVVRSARVQ